MYSVEDCQTWTKREVNDSNSIQQFRTKATSECKDSDVAKTLSTIHDNYVAVSADKALNNIVLVCKQQYSDCLKTEMGLASSQGDTTYTAIMLSKEDLVFFLSFQ